MKNFKKTNKGYAILETIFYICLFAILSIAVINALITMTKAFKETTIQAELMQGGNVMERISREIRQANSIDPASILPTDLVLNTTSGGDTKIEFKLSGSNIQLFENGSTTATGNLNTSNISVIPVTGLSFSKITTTKGTAVKISLTVKSNHDSQNRNEKFYDTIVLRGDY